MCTVTTSHNASNTNNPRLTTSSNTSYGHHSARPPAREPSACGTDEAPITYQYSVPIANRYTTLLSFQELQSTFEMISSPNDKHPPRSMAIKNRKYVTRFTKGKKLTTYHHRPTRIYPSNKHNLQERRGSVDDECETNYTPTIINGRTETTHMSQLNSTNKVSVHNLVSELRETINVNNREVGSPLTKHRVVLVTVTLEGTCTN